MFFEGAEKKCEIIVSSNVGSLLEKPLVFWQNLVGKSEATILSHVENKGVKAFLLSESSLFVWSNRILMLTCGQTKLVESAESFLDSIGVENIECVFFQRKNEYRSQLQPSDFIDDAKRLSQKIEGRVVRFGKLHSHHTLLFHSTKSFSVDEQDKTCELLMYDMAPDVIHFLTRENLGKEELREFFGLETLFSGFTFDDFVFSPYGYSLNGIKGEDYLTIHVTPQETCPYVSFETNLLICEESQALLSHFVSRLKPGSFDVLNFNCTTELSFDENYINTIHVKDELSIGYQIDFRYFNKQKNEPESMFSYNSLDEL
jgi:S-adenosylmethionine decarboxylase